MTRWWAMVMWCAAGRVAGRGRVGGSYSRSERNSRLKLHGEKRERVESCTGTGRSVSVLNEGRTTREQMDYWVGNVTGDEGVGDRRVSLVWLEVGVVCLQSPLGGRG